MTHPLVPEDIGRRQDAVQRGLVCEYLRFALARALGGIDSENYFRARWPNARGEIFVSRGDPVAAMSTITGAPLAEPTKWSAALIEALRPLSVLGRMQGFRRVPFNVKFPRVTAGGSAQWVGQGMVKPLSGMSLETVELTFSKIAGICGPVTRELAENSDPSVEELLRADMLATIAQFTDEQLLRPDIAAVADVSPASITFGATEIPSTGVTAAQVEADLADLFAAVTTNLAAPYLLMRKNVAVALAQLRSTNGDHSFPQVGAMGGSIWGTPVITSESVPADTNSPSNNLIILIDAAEVFLAEGDIEFTVLRNASLQLETSPDSPSTASTVEVSLWHHNLVAVGVNRYVRWQRRRENSVAYISGIEL